MITNIIMIIAGFAFLIKGASYLVSGAGSLARKLGISSLVVGLTVVAFGTSAPEFVVNVIAAFQGVSDIAVGNVLGSNLANILLVLGITAVVAPLTLQSNTVWREIPFSLLAAVVAVIFGADILLNGIGPDVISRSEGLALLAFFLIFIVYTFGLRKSGERPESQVETFAYSKSIILSIGGFVLLALGGHITVIGAVGIAEGLGISKNLIALTVIALGTSLPELVTAVIAVKKGHQDLAIGGVVGSNVFNILFVLASSALILPLTFNTNNLIDAIAVLFATILLFTFMFQGKKHVLERKQGIFFIVLYVGYISYAVLREVAFF